MNEYEVKQKTIGEVLEFLENCRADLSFLKLHGKSISKEDRVLAKTQKQLVEIVNTLMEYNF